MPVTVTLTRTRISVFAAPSGGYPSKPSRKGDQPIEPLPDALDSSHSADEKLTASRLNSKESRMMTLIEIKPHRNGWKVFGAPGVEPVFLAKHQAINYAENRASFRSGEIRIFDSSSNVERVIPFTEADRKL